MALGTCSSSSLRDASNIASSCVFPPLSASSLAIAANASGLRVAPAAPDHSTVLRGNRGVVKRTRTNDDGPEAN